MPREPYHHLNKERIRSCLNIIGMEDQQMAEVMGMHVTNFSKCMNLKRKMSESRVRMMAKMMDVDWRELVLDGVVAANES